MLLYCSLVQPSALLNTAYLQSRCGNAVTLPFGLVRPLRSMRYKRRTFAKDLLSPLLFIMSDGILIPKETVSTLTNTTYGDSLSDEAHSASSPSLLGEIIISSVIFAVISRQTHIYITRGGKGSIFRTVLCLWLLSAIRLFSTYSALYAAHLFSSVEQQPPRQVPKVMSAFVSMFYLAMALLALCISLILWRELYTMTGRRKVYASLVTLVVWIQAACLSIPGLGTCSVLTHALAITQIGLNGTAHALTTPKDACSSGCPRLRLPSRLRAYAPNPHSSHRQQYLAAVLMCAANLLTLYVFCKASDWIQNLLLVGKVMSQPWIRFSDVYTIVYLGIKTRHSAIVDSHSSAAGEREVQAKVDSIEMPSSPAAC
ncbi:hypothetical protein PENSPDRAFT_759898 [Peniophora sp. CONT]|nr:hypothetical protein PENSPDRAFT_759898 [Peniophora sp. CONT]